MLDSLGSTGNPSEVKMAATGGGKEKIEWVKQAVPKFIQEFKERTNQKPSPTIDSKHERNEKAGEDDDEREDETPLVCVTSNVTEEEAESFLKESYGNDAEIRIESSNNKKRQLNEEKDKADDGKMTFNKPGSKETSQKEEPKKKKSKMKKVKNTKLLSFGDQDEEDEE